MRRTIRSILCSISLLGFVPYFTHAQVTTGTPPFGSFGGGPDIINLGNLNSHIIVPVLHKGGRGGFNFTYDFSYDSSIWHPVGSSGSQIWQFVPNFGWRGITEVATGYISQTSSTVICSYTTLNGKIYPNGYKTTISNKVYHDYWGVPHPFAGSSWTKSSTCGTPTSGGQIGPTSSDGSGYALFGSGVVDKQGKFFAAPLNTTTGSATATDRNGNQISVGSSGVFTDTLGTTALTVSGTAPSPTTFTYTPPSGPNVAYTMKYTTYTVQTKFGCSGISDYGPTSNNLVTEIDLPDINVNPNDKYTFTYETTPGDTHSPHYVTGRLASVTLPTGGTITYTYTGGSSGNITCADGSASGFTRQTPDGTWTYARSIGSGAASTTTVTDPQNNQTVIQFQGIYETQRQVYVGAIAQVDLLHTWNTCYNGAASPCTGTPITLPITRRTVTDQDGPSGVQSKHDFFYSAFGVLTEQDDYDYGTSGPGALLRKVVITIAPLSNNINAFRQQVTVQNVSLATVAQTTYNYDETTPTATSGTPQHVAVSGSRGNLTSINYPVSGLTAHFTYYDTGTMNAATDVNGAVTTNSYAGSSCGNSFPTSISEPLSMSQSYVWNCNGGVQSSFTDENSKVTSTVWTDPQFWRPAATNFPDGGQTSITYNSATSVSATIKMNSTQNIVGTVLLDGLGRTRQTQLGDPQGVDYTDTTYDTLGRVHTVSNPHRSAASGTDGTTTFAYDVLNRTTSVTLQDGSVTSTSYFGNTITSTDPAGKKRQSTYDSLGRLTQVVEDPGGLGYTSTYTYDALGNLTNVVQSTSRQRTYAYDSLSRLLCESNPEIQIATCPNPDNGAYTSGTIRYGYDASGHAGDLTSRVTPAPNQTGTATVTTTYSYDSLHRLTQKSYNDGTTPTAHFVYDQTANWMSLSNTAGRITEAYIDGTPWAGTIFSYDSVGRAVLNNQCTPLNCGTGNFALNYTYDLAGDMTSYTNGSGLTFTQSFDSAGRATGLTQNLVDANHPATLATVDSSVGFYPDSALRKMTFGNGLAATWAFNNRLQPCRYNTNPSGTVIGACADAIPSGSVQDFNLGFSAGTADNGNVASIIATGTQNFSRSYTYDALNRLFTMNDSNTSQTCKGLQWTYDAWGNRTDQTQTAGACGQFHASANSQNQIVDIVNHVYQYDAAGNMTADGNHTYTYDAENRLIKVDGGSTATYLYDAFGQRVRKTAGTTPTDYVHDLSGNTLTEFNNVCAPICVARDYFYLGGQRVGEFFSGLTYFVHRDHLGSTRLISGMEQSQIPNGGFEQGMTNWLPDAGPSIVTDPTRAHSGNNYLQISTSTGAEATNSQFVAVSPGQTITFGGWAYRESGTTGVARWKLITYDANQNPITYPSPSPADVSTAAWTFQEGTYVIPTGTAFVRLYCEVYQPTTATVARFDDGFLYINGVSVSIVQNLDYLPFGELNSTDSGISTHKFTGDERDAETSLDHTQFRQYTSQLARWMSPDPAGLAAVDPMKPQSWNRYSYALNDPIDYVDPSGLTQGYPCQGVTVGYNQCVQNFFQNSGNTCQSPNQDVLSYMNCNMTPPASWDEFDLMNIPVRTEPQPGWQMSFVNGPSWTENISGTPGVPDGSYQVTSIMGSWAWGLLPGAVVGNGLDLFGGDQVGMDIWHASPQCPSCGHIFSSARDWVDAGTRWTGLGVTAVVAAPVVATVGAAANTGVIATFAEDPRAWQGTIDVVHGVFRPRSTPTTPEGLAIRIIMMYLTN